MLSDGMIDGSIRNLDVHMLTSMANAIGELPFWLPDPAATGAAESFPHPFFKGLTSPSRSKTRKS